MSYWVKCVAWLLPLAIVCLSVSVASGAAEQNRLMNTIPFEISGNLIFLQVRVNDSAPLWFILDTGASVNIIKEKRAHSLGLKLESDPKAFEGTPGAKDVKLTMGNSAMSGLPIFAAPIESLEASVGREIDGIIGSDLFNHFVVEIDYDAQRIKLYDWSTYRYQGNGEILPIIRDKESLPFVRVRLTQPEAKTAEGKFLVDTGASSALNVFGQFDKAHQLSSSINATLQSTGVGFSSKSSTRTGRIKRLQLGRFVIENPIVTFYPAAEGEPSEDEAGDGEIGGELLRRFKIILDYPHDKMILEAGPRFADPYQASLTGASIVAEGADFKTFKVRSVFDNSPAAEAGLRAGDIITAVNGKPAAQMTAEQLRQMFRQEGQSYLLKIKRGEKSLDITLKTRRLI